MSKPSFLADKIVAELRQQILEGSLVAGARLPLRDELEQIYSASRPTIQRAVTQLARDGFVVARGKLGTFVSARPPHLHHYGLVSSRYLTHWREAEYNKFRSFLYAEAVSLRQQGRRNISTYLGVDGHTDTEDYQRLLDHVRAHRLAGLIFDTCALLEGPPLSDLLEVPGLPCVGWGDPRLFAEKRYHPNLVPLVLQGTVMLDRALDYLRARGRRRVAWIANGYDADGVAHFTQGVAERGLTTRPYWIQCPAGGPSIRSARNCAQGLMELRERPDALLIGDDSLVEQATQGLVDAGVRVPQDLEVVAHCNYPEITPSLVRAKRIGFDVREALQACLDSIDRRNRGEPAPAAIEVAPRFEDELPTLAAVARIEREAAAVN